MRVALIAALSRNRVIGRNNTLPWHLPGDLQYFKRITMGKPLLMGRKTYESIGRALPGRTNMVLTRQADFRAAGIITVADPEEALALARQQQAEELMVIGGEAVYRAMLPLSQRLYLTEVDAELEGDAYFPDYDATAWCEQSREHVVAAAPGAGDVYNSGDAYSYSYVVLARRSVD